MKNFQKNSQKLGRFDQHRAAIVNCVLEGQEVVGVPHQNSNQFIDATAAQDHVECDQHPGHVDCLKMRNIKF